MHRIYALSNEYIAICPPTPYVNLDKKKNLELLAHSYTEKNSLAPNISKLKRPAKSGVCIAIMNLILF